VSVESIDIEVGMNQLTVRDGEKTAADLLCERRKTGRASNRQLGRRAALGDTLDAFRQRDQ
jgi:hypothetical protein